MKTLDLGKLPVWAGVQEKPGVSKALPFSFKLDRGLLRLFINDSDKQTIVDGYASDAYSFITTPPGASEWGNYLGGEQLKYIGEMLGDVSGKTVLEIGSGSLYVGQHVTEKLKASHFVACDPVLEKSQSAGAIEVFPDYFSWEALKDRRFDVILSMNNLEHVPDPFSYLSDIRKLLLKSNGKILLMVPDCTNGVRKGDWGICLHEHLSYFTIYSFVAIATQIGFVIHQLRTGEDKLVALMSPCDPCELMGINISDDAADFEVNGFSNSLAHARTLFADLKAKGQTPIGLHGCSVAANHLFSRLGLEKDPDIYVFDRDEAKHGKFLPSFHRAIMDVKDPMYEKMKHIVVGVTTFFPAIRKYAEGRGFRADQISPLIPF